jgi:hypothetical protein
MPTLRGRSPKNSFVELIKVSDVGGITSTLQNLTDGEGNQTTLALSSTTVAINGLAFPTTGVSAGKILAIASNGTSLEWATQQAGGGTFGNTTTIGDGTSAIELRGASSGTGQVMTIKASDTTASGFAGSRLNVQSGAPTDGNGGDAYFRASSGAGTNRTGGTVWINGGSSTGSALAGHVALIGGNSSTGTGGNVTLNAGQATSGTHGGIFITTAGTERLRILGNGAWSVGTGGTATGTSGQVLTSNGASVAPTWQTPSAGAAAAGTLTGTTLAANVVASSLTSVGTLSSLVVTGTVTSGGIELGYRSLPRVTTVDTAARGKRVAITSTAAIPSGVFAIGDALSFYNNSAASVTITTSGGLVMRKEGSATTATSLSLAAYSTAFVWFNTTTEAIVSGSVA